VPEQAAHLLPPRVTSPRALVSWVLPCLTESAPPIEAIWSPVSPLPVEAITSLLPHLPVPPLPYVLRIIASGCEQWEKGARSIVGFAGPELAIPIWVAWFWRDARGAVDLRHDWTQGIRHYEDRIAGATLPAYLQPFATAARIFLETVGYSENLGNDVKSEELLRLFSTQWIDGRTINWVMHAINMLVRDRPDLADVYVADLNVADALREDQEWASYDTSHKLTFIRNLTTQLLKEGKRRIVIPIHVKDVHWAVYLLDLDKSSIRYGDSLRWSVDHADVRRLQRWAAKMVDAVPKLERGLESAHQGEDSYSCAVVVWNTVERLLFDGSPWTHQEADVRRVSYAIMLCVTGGTYSCAHFGLADDTFASGASARTPCLRRAEEDFYERVGDDEIDLKDVQHYSRSSDYELGEDELLNTSSADAPAQSSSPNVPSDGDESESYGHPSSGPQTLLHLERQRSVSASDVSSRSGSSYMASSGSGLSESSTRSRRSSAGKVFGKAVSMVKKAARKVLSVSRHVSPASDMADAPSVHQPHPIPSGRKHVDKRIPESAPRKGLLKFFGAISSKDAVEQRQVDAAQWREGHAEDEEHLVQKKRVLSAVQLEHKRRKDRDRQRVRRAQVEAKEGESKQQVWTRAHILVLSLDHDHSLMISLCFARNSRRYMMFSCPKTTRLVTPIRTQQSSRGRVVNSRSRFERSTSRRRRGGVSASTSIQKRST
jgi:hypothetical protein